MLDTIAIVNSILQTLALSMNNNIATAVKYVEYDCLKSSINTSSHRLFLGISDKLFLWICYSLVISMYCNPLVHMGRSIDAGVITNLLVRAIFKQQHKGRCTNGIIAIYTKPSPINGEILVYLTLLCYTWSNTPTIYK